MLCTQHLFNERSCMSHYERRVSLQTRHPPLCMRRNATIILPTLTTRSKPTKAGRFVSPSCPPDPYPCCHQDFRRHDAQRSREVLSPEYMSTRTDVTLSRLVSDQGDNHAVEVEEEHEQVEAQFDERLLLVHVELAEDLGGVEEVLVFEDPAQ
jgi:hypothetical protein